MEPEGLLPHSQVPATCPYPLSTLSSPHNFLKIYLNIILPSMPGPPQWALSARFPHQDSCSYMKHKMQCARKIKLFLILKTGAF
jgi:hypothetical protein